MTLQSPSDSFILTCGKKVEWHCYGKTICMGHLDTEIFNILEWIDVAFNISCLTSVYVHAMHSMPFFTDDMFISYIACFKAFGQ
jgi:hypothetical protein